MYGASVPAGPWRGVGEQRDMILAAAAIASRDAALYCLYRSRVGNVGLHDDVAGTAGLYARDMERTRAWTRKSRKTT